MPDNEIVTVCCCHNRGTWSLSDNLNKPEFSLFYFIFFLKWQIKLAAGPGAPVLMRRSAACLLTSHSHIVFVLLCLAGASLALWRQHRCAQHLLDLRTRPAASWPWVSSGPPAPRPSTGGVHSPRAQAHGGSWVPLCESGLSESVPATWWQSLQSGSVIRGSCRQRCFDSGRKHPPLFFSSSCSPHPQNGLALNIILTPSVKAATGSWALI